MAAAVEMQRSQEEVVQPRRPRLTRRILLVLGLMNLVDCVNVNILTPYVEELMAMLLHKPVGDPTLTFPIAALIGLYSICEFVFSYMWGALADRTGRRPALLIGITGSAVAPIFMGTARTMFQAFFARGLDGFFCGNVGVSKAYLGELVEPGNEASSFSFLALTFSCGLILGPIFGGQLVRPAEWAPGVFEDTIFDTYPFLLANASYATLAVLALIVGATSLEETLPAEKRKSVCPTFCCRRRQQAREALLAASSEQQAAASSSTTSQNPLAPPLLDGQVKDAEAAQPEPQQPSQTECTAGVQEPPPRLCGLGPLLWSNIIYCCLSSYFTEWAQLFVVLTSADLRHKGFEFKPNQIGNLQLCAAAGLLFTQLLAYPRFCKRFGYFRAFQLGAVANLVVTLLFPLFTHWADPEEYGMWRYVPLALFQAIGQAGAGFMFPTVFVWINRSAPPAIKGQANGLVNTTGALTRALWPQLCGLMTQALSSETLSVWWRFAMLPINGVLLCVCLIVLHRFPRSFSGLPSDAATRQPEESDAGKSPTSSTPSEDSEGGVSAERGA